MRQRRVSYHTSRAAAALPLKSPLPRDRLLSNRVNATLVVEERRTSTRLINDLFRRLGFTDVQTAHSAEDALRMLRERKFGLVLADWDLSGLSFLRAVKTDEKLRRTPVVITAAHLTCEQVVLARRTGADALILKPFLVSALRSKIEEIAINRTQPHFTSA